MDQTQVKENYYKTLARIERAAISAGRSAGAIRLVVVTKGHPLSIVKAAIAAGATTLGENYVEEGVSKILALADLPGVEWHMIGHIQSRKARLVCEHYQVIHSLDSLKLARRLDRFAAQQNRVMPVLLEQNISGESSKSGFAAWDESKWDSQLAEVEAILSMDHLSVQGLMSIPPFADDPEEARPYFQRLVCLRDFLAAHFRSVQWSELSMGMSADFEIAIQEGATIVRVGQAILGPRPAS